jgi:isopenicillin N synthase-like dioxygenase
MTQSSDSMYPQVATELLFGETEMELASCVRSVETALRSHGSFLLVSDSPDPVATNALASWHAFCALSLSEKMQHHKSVKRYGAQGGWHLMREEPVYMSHMAESERHVEQAKEQFGCGVRCDETLWPDEAFVPGFSTRVQVCASWFDAVARRVLAVFESVLGEKSGFLQYSPGYLTLSMYPGQAQTPESTAGLHEHSDADVFTMLTQPIRGLQIRNNAGDWSSVPVLSGNELLVIPGDWMELFSNGHFRAVRHRVLDVAEQRASIAFFQNVAKMSIRPLGKFVRAERDRYPTVESDIGYAGGQSGVPRWRTQSQDQ